VWAGCKTDCKDEYESNGTACSCSSILIKAIGVNAAIRIASAIFCAALLQMIIPACDHRAQSDRAAPARADDINRYQITAVSSKVLFRIDTKTGKVWLYDKEDDELLTLEYAHEHGYPSTITQEWLDKMMRDGYVVALPYHWRELSEKPGAGALDIRSHPNKP
jgi:hypothetical protein